MTTSRVVITGLGAVSPLGLTVEEMWAGLSAGRCGIGRIKAFDPTGFPCELGGEVPALPHPGPCPARTCAKPSS